MIYFKLFVRETVACQVRRVPWFQRRFGRHWSIKGTFMRTGFLILLALVTSGPIGAQSIAVEEVGCLPNQLNQFVQASLSSDPGSSTVRLYFRRLNPVGAFYYNQMWPEGKNSYWSVFPKPEDREQEQLSDEWWSVLAERDWMQVEGRDREWLEDWLADQELEAAEYYVSLHDAKNEMIERSDVYVVSVTDPEDCETSLTPPERGWAQNLTIGETTNRQYGRAVFHWLCDGIVTRRSVAGLLRGDDYCRECVIAHVDGVLPSIQPLVQFDVSRRLLCS